MDEIPVQFDTLDFARRLEKAGVPNAQAEAHARLFSDIFTKSVASRGDLMQRENMLSNKLDAMSLKFETKLDAVSLKFENKLETTNSRLTKLEWMLGFVVAMCSGILFKLLH